jgi:hypothetical protein
MTIESTGEIKGDPHHTRRVDTKHKDDLTEPKNHGTDRDGNQSQGRSKSEEVERLLMGQEATDEEDRRTR